MSVAAKHSVSSNVELVMDGLFFPLTDQANYIVPNRNELCSTTVNHISKTMATSTSLHVSSNLWRTLRRWIRLLIVQQGVTGEQATLAASYVEERFHANSRALGASMEARANAAAPANNDDDGDDAGAGNRGGKHATRPKPAVMNWLRAQVNRVRVALGLPPLPPPPDPGPPAPAPPVPHAPTTFPTRDLLGDLERLAVLHGYFDARLVNRPPAGPPPAIAATSRYAAIEPALRPKLDELAHRMFAALPRVCSRKHAASRPTLFMPLLHLLGEHRDDYRAFLVRLLPPHLAHTCTLKARLGQTPMLTSAGSVCPLAPLGFSTSAESKRAGARRHRRTRRRTRQQQQQQRQRQRQRQRPAQGRESGPAFEEEGRWRACARAPPRIAQKRSRALTTYAIRTGTTLLMQLYEANIVLNEQRRRPPPLRVEPEPQPEPAPAAMPADIRQATDLPARRAARVAYEAQEDARAAARTAAANAAARTAAANAAAARRQAQNHARATAEEDAANGQAPGPAPPRQRVPTPALAEAVAANARLRSTPLRHADPPPLRPLGWVVPSDRWLLRPTAATPAAADPPSPETPPAPVPPAAARPPPLHPLCVRASLQLAVAARGPGRDHTYVRCAR